MVAIQHVEEGDEAAYYLLLELLLLTLVRGSRGVSVVTDFILHQWGMFRADFDQFCIGLVRHCESVCHTSSLFALSHLEGLHKFHSGIFFVRTLRLARCRKALCVLARVCPWGPFVLFCSPKIFECSV